MKKDSVCVCVLGLILAAISGHNRAFGLLKPEATATSPEVAGCRAEGGVKGHHLDSFSYLGTSPLALIEVRQCGPETYNP